MPRRCSICTHAEREEIDKALVAGASSVPAIATLFDVSQRALYRHREKHLPETLAQAQEAREVAQADDLLAQLEGLRKEAHRIKDKAEKGADYRTALAGIRELVRIVELMAKVRGELAQEGAVTVVLMPEWVALRTTILAALLPFPDARLAVARALRPEGVPPRGRPRIGGDGHAQD